MSVSWFLIGLVAGIELGLVYHWLELRRLERRISIVYRGTLDFTKPVARRALQDKRKPW
jgi:hypothetical protein